MLQNLPQIRKKIVIVDDFDRLDCTIQKEVFTLFNLLKNKRWYHFRSITFIFVGDYFEIYGNQMEGYLPKIIDKRIALPFDLQPSYAWARYFEKLYKYMNVKKDDYKKELKAFEKLFKNNNRTLRDLAHFNDYVNQEFFVRKKYGYVDPIEQLYVIYVYLFEPSFYQKLLDVTYQPTKSTTQPINDDWSPKDVAHDIFSNSSHRHRNSFSNKPNSYFVGETTRNLLDEDIEKMLKSPDVESLIFKRSAGFFCYDDVYEYVRSADTEKSTEIIDTELFRLAVHYYIKESNHSFAQLIVEDKLLRIVILNPENKQKYIEIIENIFSVSEYDVTEKIYFTLRAGLTGALTERDIIVKIQEKFRAELELDKFETFRKPVYFTIFYFSDTDNWTVEIWNQYFEKLSNVDFSLVCLYLELPLFDKIKNKYVDPRTNSIKDQKVSELFEKKALKYWHDTR